MPGALCQISICITWVPNGLSISHGHQNPRNVYGNTCRKKYLSQCCRLVSARMILFIRNKHLNLITPITVRVRNVQDIRTVLKFGIQYTIFYDTLFFRCTSITYVHRYCRILKSSTLLIPPTELFILALLSSLI